MAAGPQWDEQAHRRDLRGRFAPTGRPHSTRTVAADALASAEQQARQDSEPWASMPNAARSWREVLRVDRNRLGQDCPHLVEVEDRWPIDTTNNLDPDTVDLFTMGGCHYLAAALHDRTGWPVVAIGSLCATCDEGASYDSTQVVCEHQLEHLAVRAPDGMLWDVRGPASDPAGLADDGQAVLELSDEAFTNVLDSWETPAGTAVAADHTAGTILAE